MFVDLGIGPRLFKKRVREYGVNLGSVCGILVTHDHTDHVKSVGSASSAYGLPVYASSAVHERIDGNFLIGKKIPSELRRTVEAGCPLQIGPFSVEAAVVPHDSRLNYGYAITAGGIKLCVVTDVGHFTDEVDRLASGADYLVVEANYDGGMLESGGYPERLKQRISGGEGHSENKQTAVFVARVATERLKHVWLCHLSAENNRAELAVAAVSGTLAGLDEPLRGIAVEALPRREAAGPFCLTQGHL